MALGEIPDLATLELEAKIEEIDRGRISVGQDVRVSYADMSSLEAQRTDSAHGNKALIIGAAVLGAVAIAAAAGSGGGSGY